MPKLSVFLAVLASSTGPRDRMGLLPSSWPAEMLASRRCGMPAEMECASEPRVRKTWWTERRASAVNAVALPPLPEAIHNLSGWRERVYWEGVIAHENLTTFLRILTAAIKGLDVTVALLGSLCGILAVRDVLSDGYRVYYAYFDDGRNAGSDSWQLNWRRYCEARREHREKVAKLRRCSKRREYHRRRRFFAAKNCTFEVGKEGLLRNTDGSFCHARRKPCPFDSYRQHSASRREGRLMASCLRRGRRSSHCTLLNQGTRVSVASATVQTVAQLRQAMHERYAKMLHVAATQLQARWRGFWSRNKPPCVSCCEHEGGKAERPWWQSMKQRCCASESSCFHQVGGGEGDVLVDDGLIEEPEWEAKPVGDDSKRTFWLKDVNGNKYGTSFDFKRARHPVTHQEANPRNVAKKDRPDWMKKWVTDLNNAKCNKKRAPWRKQARNDDVRQREKEQKAALRAKQSKVAKPEPESKDQKAASTACPSPTTSDTFVERRTSLVTPILWRLSSI